MKRGIGWLVVVLMISAICVSCGAGGYNLDPLKLYDNGYVGREIDDSEMEGWSYNREYEYYYKEIDSIAKGYKTTGRIHMEFGDNTVRMTSYLLKPDTQGKISAEQLKAINEILDKLVEEHGEPTEMSGTLGNELVKGLTVEEVKAIGWEEPLSDGELTDVYMKWKNNEALEYRAMAVDGRFSIMIHYLK